MKTKSFLRKHFISVFAMCSMLVSSAFVNAEDNEVLLDQTGDNLTLTILQAGTGNKISGDSSEGSDLVITGSSLIIDIIQDGDSNKMYGAWTLDGNGTSVLDFYQAGSSNVWDLNFGATGSADYADMLVDIQGDTNIFDMDVGGNASAEYLNFDLIILGSRNDFSTSFTNTNIWAAAGVGDTCGTNCTGSQALAGIVIDADSVVWNFDITGDDNAFATKQSGNSGHSLTVDLTGSDGDFQFIQDMTTTCTPACAGIINMTLDSENASVSVKQTD